MSSWFFGVYCMFFMSLIISGRKNIKFSTNPRLESLDLVFYIHYAVLTFCEVQKNSSWNNMDTSSRIYLPNKKNIHLSVCWLVKLTKMSKIIVGVRPERGAKKARLFSCGNKTLEPGGILYFCYITPGPFLTRPNLRSLSKSLKSPTTLKGFQHEMKVPWPFHNI